MEQCQQRTLGQLQQRGLWQRHTEGAIFSDDDVIVNEDLEKTMHTALWRILDHLNISKTIISIIMKFKLCPTFIKRNLLKKKNFAFKGQESHAEVT